MAIAVPDELQESVRPGTGGHVWQVCVRSVTFRWPSCQSSREPMCLGALSEGVRDARWTQIDAIARVDVPCRALEGRLACQVN